MRQQIASAGLARLGALASPDQEHAGDSQELPSQEERQQIARKDGRHSTARLSNPGEVLHAVLKVHRVDAANKGRKMEQVAEQEAQLVHAKNV